MHQKTPGVSAQLSAHLMFHNKMWRRQAMKKNESIIGKDCTEKKYIFIMLWEGKNNSKDDEDFLNKILFLNIPFQTS